MKLDIEKFSEVYEFAKDAHGNQRRKVSGKPYITHPLAVAKIAFQNGADDDTIRACLLHDVVEDTEISLDEINERFGEIVSFLVDGVTKIDKNRDATHKKVCDYAMKDKRVIFIKIADCIHNSSTPINDEAWKKRYNKSVKFYINFSREIGFMEMVDELEELSKNLVSED